MISTDPYSKTMPKLSYDGDTTFRFKQLLVEGSGLLS